MAGGQERGEYKYFQGDSVYTHQIYLIKTSLLFLITVLFFLPLPLMAENHTLETLTAEVDKLEKELASLKKQMTDLTAEAKSDPLPPSSMSIAGVPIISSPYLGEPPAFDGSDLIVNMPTLNQDVALMEQREKLISEMAARPIVLISGNIQPIWVEQKEGASAWKGNMSVFDIELNMAAIVNPWVEGYFTVVSGTSAYPTPLPENNSSDSTIENTLTPTIDVAIVNIGNLKKTPFYLSAGQIYVPFGQSITNMVTFPMSLVMGQTRTIATVYGYSSGGNNGFSATAYAYHTNTTLGRTGAGGGSVTYQFGLKSVVMYRQV